MKNLVTILIALVFVLLLGLRAQARTQMEGTGIKEPAENPAKVEAGKLYKTGAEKFKGGLAAKKAGKLGDARVLFGEARSSFEAAYRYDPSDVLLFNMARAAEEVGEFKIAVGHYREYLARNAQAADAEQVKGSIKALELAISLQEAQAARAEQPPAVTSSPPQKLITCTIELRDVPADATAKINGKLIEDPKVPFTTDCYEQRVEVYKNGVLVNGGRVAMTPDKTSTWVFEPNNPVIGVVTPNKVEPIKETSLLTRRQWSYIAFGGAGLGAMGGAVFGLMAKNSFEEAEHRHHNPDFTVGQVESSMDVGKSYQTGMFISAGVAAAALGTALYLFFTDSVTEPTSPPAVISTPSGVTFTW